MPTMVRLEMWSGHGWTKAHGAVALLHPEQYPLRLLERAGKIARAIELDERLQPTGMIWGPPPEAGVQQETSVDAEECEWCLGAICDGDGECLI